MIPKTMKNVMDTEYKKNSMCKERRAKRVAKLNSQHSNIKPTALFKIITSLPCCYIYI